MAKKLKKTAVYNGKTYYRGLTSYKTREEIDKKADSYRKSGKFNVIIDKNKNGYFMWSHRKPLDNKRLKISK